MLSQSETTVLTARLQQRIALIGDRAAGVVARAWLTMDARNEADIPAFTARVAPIMNATKTAGVRTGTGYYSSLLQVRPPGIAVTDIVVADELREPFIAYWQALANGHPIEDAVTSGAARSEAIARNLAVSSSRRAGDAVVSATGVEIVGWRRALDGKACAWCAGLTGTIFRTAEATDFGHDRCGCSALPVVA